VEGRPETVLQAIPRGAPPGTQERIFDAEDGEDGRERSPNNIAKRAENAPLDPENLTEIERFSIASTNSPTLFKQSQPPCHIYLDEVFWICDPRSQFASTLSHSASVYPAPRMTSMIQFFDVLSVRRMGEQRVQHISRCCAAGLAATEAKSINTRGVSRSTAACCSWSTPERPQRMITVLTTLKQLRTHAERHGEEVEEVTLGSGKSGSNCPVSYLRQHFPNKLTGPIAMLANDISPDGAC